MVGVVARAAGVGEVVAVAQLAHVKTIWSEERRRVQLGLCLISFVEFLRFALVKEFFYCQVIPDRHSAKKFFLFLKNTVSTTTYIDTRQNTLC
jgi:hypothetical protein